MRGLTPLALLAVSCGTDPSVGARPELGRYLHEAAFRRFTLERSLVSTRNRYARLRLARYDTHAEGDWARLPVWNPPSAPVREGDLTHPEEAPAGVPLALDPAAMEGQEAALLAVGREAFWRYPAMLLPERTELALAEGILDPDRYGFWRNPRDGRLGGLVRVTLADGTRALSVTCSTCHASEARGELLAGLANARFDLGALNADANPTLPSAFEANLRAWGPGRVDVATAAGTEPLAIPDLRPLRDQRYLHRAGAVAQRSIATLAVRVETLLITGYQQAVRPPREVSAGLAVYLWSLADTLPVPDARRPGSDPGAAIFAARCAGCHGARGQGGDLVLPEDARTDGALARSVERGTGFYRAPSLRGVALRALLLHDGSLPGLDALLNPERRGSTPPAARPLHPFALDLPSAERRALGAFLATL